MKGYIKLIVGLGVTMIIFYLINGILNKLLSQSASVSDQIAITYKLVNIIELVKLNAWQNFNFSINRTLDDMGINFTDLKTDATLQQTFLTNLAQKFDPQPLVDVYSKRLPFIITIDTNVDRIDFDLPNSIISAVINISVSDVTGRYNMGQEATVYKKF